MKNIKISVKLIILTLILSSIIAFVGIMGIQNMETVDAGLETMYTDRGYNITLNQVQSNVHTSVQNSIKQAEGVRLNLDNTDIDADFETF